MRSTLAKVRPRYAGPDSTSGSYDGMIIRLDIRHRAAPRVGMHLVFGDVQTLHRRLGHVYAIDTEVWEEDGRRDRLGRRRIWRRAPLALLPWPAASQRRSLSFDRRPPFAPE